MANERSPSSLRSQSRPVAGAGNNGDWPERGQAAIASESLLLGRASVTIAHEGMNYILRATRAGKLILTK
ncbi:MAG: hemin uptake protein HemP [Aromatoleum sp.]|uniref:hemin uptake protein HemP n=1 Tax=Aromatoleum sp. TaxID=2307007 RepID=UPI002895695C|nr:hemin uptake protein HemP [Aromatoleum sp.]MDT3671961.1 hemin uptake protein HemP [Aromatoleum sp.]